MNTLFSRVHCAVFGDPFDIGEEERAENVEIIHKALLTEERPALKALFRDGPVYLSRFNKEGAAQVSKLVAEGFAAYVVKEGDSDYAALTSRGYWLHQCAAYVQTLVPDEVAV